MLSLYPSLAILALASSIAIGMAVARAIHTPTPILTPFQQIFADAATIITTQGLCVGRLTTNDAGGIGQPIPHCILGAVAAADPNYVPGHLFELDSVLHLMTVSDLRVGMTPTTVNDTLGEIAVLELLDFAIADTTL